MIDSEKIFEAEKEIIIQIETFKAGLINRFNPDDYIKLLECYSEDLPYRYISDDVRRFCSLLLKESNEFILELFHKLILIKLISKNQAKIKNKFPDQIDFWFQKNFLRIFKNINDKSKKKGIYLYPNDQFFKILAVCSLRMIPAGSQKLDVSGFSRSFFIKNGMSQFFKSILFYFFKYRGNTPYYQMHTDSNDLDLLREFAKSDKGSAERFYLNVSALLRSNPKIKGVFGSSWMNDPQLEQISPTIFYGTKIALENGGCLFALNTTAQDIKDATRASSKRTNLFKEGKYYPKVYLMIWPRNQLLKWSKRQDEAR